MPEAKMRIKILGSFRLIKDHNVYDDEIWKSKKALQIFKYLVSQQGKKVPKDIIMELFWPDNDLDQVANLHTTIYYIRKTLDQLHKGFASCLKSSKGLYSFESKDSCIIDINEFDNFYNLALNNHKEKKFDKALKLYYQTINLYQGDFLQEDLYDDWAYILRQEYREKYIDIVLRSNYILSEIQEKYIEANNICEKGLNIDPYREELYRSIIYNYIKSNNYIYAIKRYKEYSKMLEQEFDIEPVQEIKELFEGLDVAATQDEKEDIVFYCNNEKVLSHGPYICNSNIFFETIKIQLRRNRRKPVDFCVFAILINTKEYLPIRREIIKILDKTLRQGDLICIWEEKNIIINLYNISKEQIPVVDSRIKNGLSNRIRSVLSIKHINSNSFDKEDLLQQLI